MRPDTVTVSEIYFKVHTVFRDLSAYHAAFDLLRAQLFQLGQGSCRASATQLSEIHIIKLTSGSPELAVTVIQPASAEWLMTGQFTQNSAVSPVPDNVTV